MTTLYDIHTHHNAVGDGVISIQNLLSEFDHIPSKGWYSVGLHPWYLQIDQINALPESFVVAAGLSNVLAIGECGLDRVCETQMDLQRTVFLRQMILANEVGKPLIIHSVRAFDEILSMLRKHRVSVPVIFHGFRQSDQMAMKILHAGHFLSFGRHLMLPSVAEVFRKLPADRVFLETDDADVSLIDIYSAAASIRGVDIESLRADIGSLFKQVFRPVTDLI